MWHCLSASEASWRRGFDPCTPLLFDLYHDLRTERYFGWVPGPPHRSSQVLRGYWVRHPLGSKKVLVWYWTAKMRWMLGCNNGILGFHEKFQPQPPLLHPIECHKLQIAFRKRASNFRALVRELPCKDKASFASWPPCMCVCRLNPKPKTPNPVHARVTYLCVRA